jgi:protein-disulfide isomerase
VTGIPVEDVSRLTYAPQLVLPVSGRDHIQGSPNASKVLVEYGDYECPYCGAAHPIVKQVQATMEDELAFVFRHFPLSNVHVHAWKAAEAAEAAGAQGAFWEMHDILFTHQEALDEPALVRYARALDLDVPRFIMELEEDVYSTRVHEDFRSGILSGVNGTPTFFVNGVRHDGRWDAESLLRALRGRAEGVQSRDPETRGRS